MTWPILLLLLQLLGTTSDRAHSGTSSYTPGATPTGPMQAVAAPADSGNAMQIVDFGSVPVGLVRDTVVRLYAPNPDQIVSLRQSGGPGDRFFRIGSFMTDTSAKDSIDVAIRFYPELRGFLHTSTVYADRRQLPSDSFDLRGRGDTTLSIRYPGDTVRPASNADTIFFRDTPVNSSDTQRIVITTTRNGAVPIVHRFAGPTPSGVYYFGARPGSGDTLYAVVRDTARVPIIFSPRAAVTTIDSIRLGAANGSRIFYLKGTGKPPIAEIRVNRDSLLFPGWVRCRRDSFDIINSGPGPLTVRLELIAMPPGAFRILTPRNAEIPLDSGSRLTVVVEYCGDESDTGRIVVRSSNTVDSIIEIPMRATPTSPLTPSQSFDFRNVRTCDTLVTTLKNESGTDVVIDDIFFFGSGCGYTLLAPARRDTILEPGGTLEIAVAFCTGCTNGTTTAFDTLVIVGNNSDTLALIPARATIAPQSRLVFKPEPARLVVDSGQCDTLRMSVRNVETLSDTLILSSLEMISGGVLTIIDPEPGSELILPPGGIDTVLFLYCPLRAGDSLVALWTLTSRTTQPARIQIEGTSPGRPPGTVEERLIWLGDTSANAGDLLTLPVRVAPGLPPSRPISGYRLRLRYDPRALFPVGATNAGGGETLSMSGSEPESGILRITYVGSTVGGGTLARIVFRGLSTGQEINIVSLDSGAIAPDVPVRLGDSGVVRLFGCDIGRPSGLNRRATIRNLSVSGSEAIIRYIAPEGSIAILRLTSSAGTVVRTIELPVATAGEQTSPVDLSDVPPGFYLLELRVGDGRSTIPLMIAQ